MAQGHGKHVLGLDIGGTSVKGVVLDGTREVRAARSAAYSRPGRSELAAAMAEVVRKVAAGAEGIGCVGVCAPGLRDESGTILRAVNVPGLEGASAVELVEAAVRGGLGITLARNRGRATVYEFTDAYAAAMDYRRMRPGEGRMLALSMGTGVGACVLDYGEGGQGLPLIVSGGGPGHIGHMDVTVDEAGEGVPAGRPVPRGPDGARGTLEAYMGFPPLRERFGDGLDGAVRSGGLRTDRAPLAALVKAVRIAHAVYRPRRVVLLGGVGLALRPLAGEIRAAVADGLTTLAREGWTLEVGEDDLHAARGAAWLAGVGG